MRVRVRVIAVVVVYVAMSVAVGLDSVDVCFESLRVIVLVLGRRVRTALATRFIVCVEKVAIRGGLPDMAAIRIGERVLCIGRSRRKVRGGEGVAVTMMVSCWVAAQRQRIARGHVYISRCRRRRPGRRRREE